MSRKSDTTMNDEHTKEEIYKKLRAHPRIARLCVWLYRNKLILSFLMGVVYRTVKHYLEWMFEW